MTQKQHIKIKDDSSFKASPADQRQSNGKEDTIWDSAEKGPRSQYEAIITILSKKLTSPFKISSRALTRSSVESSLTEIKMRHFSKNTEIQFYWQKASRTSPGPISLKGQSCRTSCILNWILVEWPRVQKLFQFDHTGIVFNSIYLPSWHFKLWLSYNLPQVLERSTNASEMFVKFLESGDYLCIMVRNHLSLTLWTL